MSCIQETVASLEQAARQHDAVAVGVSGGKDSLVTLNLCVRFFKRVVPYHLYFVPGIQVEQQAVRRACQPYGLEAMELPHWVLWKALRSGMYCRQPAGADELRELSHRETYDLVKIKTGCTLIATGARKADSLWRRRYMGATKHWTDILYPAANWTKLDILSYLKTQGIKPPDSSGANATGVDLSTPSLLWLHDSHPDDFDRLCRFFPFARAVVARRTFYGAPDGNEEKA